MRSTASIESSNRKRRGSAIDMVGVNIGDIFTPSPWTPEKIEHALAEARSSGYFSCDAVKFWHCFPERILPTASQDHIRKVRV